MALSMTNKKQVCEMSDIEFAEKMNISVVKTKRIRQSQGVEPTPCKVDFSKTVKEGEKAFADGLKQSDCPYESMVRRSYWLAGWHNADMGY